MRCRFLLWSRGRLAKRASEMRPLAALLLAALAGAECERAPPETFAQSGNGPAPPAAAPAASTPGSVTSDAPVAPAPTPGENARCIQPTPGEPPPAVAPGPAPGCPPDPEGGAGKLPVVACVVSGRGRRIGRCGARAFGARFDARTDVPEEPRRRARDALRPPDPRRPQVLDAQHLHSSRPALRRRGRTARRDRRERADAQRRVARRGLPLALGPRGQRRAGPDATASRRASMSCSPRASVRRARSQGVSARRRPRGRPLPGRDRSWRRRWRRGSALVRRPGARSERRRETRNGGLPVAVGTGRRNRAA